MNSKIYKGSVMHARLEPVRHAFRYPVYFYAFDLADLPRLNTMGLLTGYNRSGVVSVRDSDHFGAGAGTIREKLDDYLRDAGCDADVANVLMVTSARYFGHMFNPVSFFYCHRTDGSLRCVVAEVNNTFGERHVYVLSDPQEADAKWLGHFATQKKFYVSPFNNVAGDYDFKFSGANGSVDIRIDLLKEGKTVMKTQMEGTSLPLTAGNLARTIVAQPLSALLTIPRIHWQAAKIYFGKKLALVAKPKPSDALTLRVAKPALADRVAMKLVLPLLRHMNAGCLRIILPDLSEMTFGDAGSARIARMKINDYRAFRRFLNDGDIGLGESYTAGEWETDDLVGLLNLFITNWQVVEKDTKTVRFGRVLSQLAHLRRANTLTGSRKNIRDHYDLGNDFFRLFLDDETMMYSAAFHRDEAEPLADAQRSKLRMLIEKAEIKSTDHVLEIGCGWGGFAIEAVRRTGCRVTAITISQAQFDLATQRVKEAGLSDRIEIKICDYRHIEGQFDKVVSIEMIEAVGHEFLGEYFAAIDRALKPGGKVALQGITIPHERYANYCRDLDWIRKHIFPGGHLPSLEAIEDALKTNSTLKVSGLEDIGPHYALTLREWRKRFLAQREKIAAMGFDSEFIRKWDYYFALCEASFESRVIGNHHLVLTR